MTTDTIAPEQELLTQPTAIQIGDLDTHFYMNRLEVDGIEGHRKAALSYGLMFSLKSELNLFDVPEDIGRPMVWKADLKISERHWLVCGELIPEGAVCPECGERNIPGVTEW